MIMWRELVLGAGAAAVLAVVSAVADQTMPPHPATEGCFTVPAIAGVLAEKYGERPFARGLDQSGLLLELFTADSGTWTILMSSPDGCVRGVRSGTGFDAGRPA